MTNNYQLPAGRYVYVLTVDDMIEPTDWCRDTIESAYDGGFNTTFKPDEWRGTMWHLCETELSGWIGKSYKQYMKFANIDFQMHELIRVQPDDT